MNGTARLIGLLMALITLSFGVMARDVVPIVNYDDILVASGSGKPVSNEQVREAIVNAARANNWVVGKVVDKDVLSATLLVKGKHTVVVSIPYSADKFSIRYQDSSNMKYSLAKPAMEGSTDLTKINSPARNLQAETPMIHPAYNKWVQALLQSIRLELTRL